MKRRLLQFSLRGLLGLASFVCLLLGGRHLLVTYGNRLDVEDAKVGAPIRVKARYFCVLGPSECALEAGYRPADGSMLWGVYTDLVEREWLCLYRGEWELPSSSAPCRITVTFTRFDTPDFVIQKIVDVK